MEQEYDCFILTSDEHEQFVRMYYLRCLVMMEAFIVKESKEEKYAQYNSLYQKEAGQLRQLLTTVTVHAYDATSLVPTKKKGCVLR